MDNILGYYVFDTARGWLAEDEETWTPNFNDAASLTSADLANDVGNRQSPGASDTFYIFACLGSM